MVIFSPVTLECIQDIVQIGNKPWHNLKCKSLSFRVSRFLLLYCSDYINRFLKSHGWDVASDQPDSAPTTVTNSRTWDNWMESTRLEDLGQDSTNNENIDVTHAAAASVTTTSLSSVNTSNSAPGSFHDELVAFKLKEKN